MILNKYRIGYMTTINGSATYVNPLERQSRDGQ